MLVTGQFNDGFLPIMDGVTNVVKNYAAWLHLKHGHSYVVTPSFPNYVDHEPYTVLRYPSIPIPFRAPYRQGLPSLDGSLLTTLRKIPFDIIHTHTPFSAGNLAVTTARKRGIPVIASFHSKYYDDLYAALKVEAAARYGVRRIVDFYESVDYVWTVNHGTADTLREYGFKGHIDVVPNGTDFSPPADYEKLREEADLELGLHGSYPVLLYVGQHVWQKNLKTLLEALSQVKRAGQFFRMLMVGSGYAEEELKILVESLGLCDEVRFLGSVRDRERLKRIYCRADLFFFPSIYDNASIALREAAACLCPALLIKGANTAEGIVDGENGFLSVDTPGALATRILEVVREPEALKAAGLHARQTVYMSWDSVMEEVNGRYQEISKTGIYRSRSLIIPISPPHLHAQLNRQERLARRKYRLIRRRITRLVRRIL